MKLALSSMISEIDKYMSEVKGVPIPELVDRSGEAIYKFVCDNISTEKRILILAGSGNNGADGYSLAIKLLGKYTVTVYDVFGCGPKCKIGRELYDKFVRLGGKVIAYEPGEASRAFIKSAGCIVDAIFGTGFCGEVPKLIEELSVAVRESTDSYKIAVDVPLGINADNGSVSDFAISVDATVVLSFLKPGIISYPARSYVGRIVFDSIGIDECEISEKFDFRYHMIDEEWVRKSLPRRPENSHKGCFGKLLMITGSKRYRGAAHLSLEAGLRGGAGLVSFVGEGELCEELMQKFPEAIYKPINTVSQINESEIEEILKLDKSHTVTLIGSGSDNTEGLLKLTSTLLASEGGALILDADAINVLSMLGKEGIERLKNAKRTVVLTPHPLELARLTGIDVSYLQLNRLSVAENFARETGVILVLKGAGTIVTNGEDVYINTVATSALAKAGSGDVLAGLIASLLAGKSHDAIKCEAMAVYFHSKAGENLAREYSDYGVTPSDLPREIGRQIQKIQ